MLAEETIIDGVLDIPDCQNFPGYRIIKTLDREIGKHLRSGRILSKDLMPIDRPTPSSRSSDGMRIHNPTRKCPENIAGRNCKKSIPFGEMVKIIRILGNTSALKINFHRIISNRAWDWGYIINLYAIGSPREKARYTPSGEGILESGSGTDDISSGGCRQSGKRETRSCNWRSDCRYPGESKYQGIG